MTAASRPLPPRLILAALAVLFAGGIVIGANGMMRVWEMERDLGTLERDIVQLRVETQRLSQTVDKLRNDPAYIERVARETLGLVRPGETILKFPPQPAK